jgi:DNA modification methylase
MADNTLYYGDNLDILRRYIKDETVDLVYLDPPFKSNQDYNILFAEQNGSRAAAQIKAFEDTWRWDQAAAEAYEEVVEAGGKASQVMQAFRTFLGENDMLAYLAMMAPRLVELRRVLKATGSIYLHCDPTASHYLKLLMDAVFGPESFRNEIVWQRTGAHSDARRWGRVSDTLLFYTKTDRYVWHTQHTEYDEAYVAQRYHYKDEKTGRLFWPNTMTAAGPGPARRFRGKLVDPPSGTHWRFSQEQIDRMEAEGHIYYSSGGKPYVKSYLDERQGKPVQSIWTDIRMTKSGAERLGYPTQKPEALLERVINASTNEGETVLDPFCGCGTAVAVAHRLKRRWIGIDITHLAVTLIKNRLRDAFREQVADEYEVVGEPVSLPDAQTLAAQDPYQFQWWALGLVGARPAEQKKGADEGIDGRLYFHDEADGAKTKQVVLSVKSGNVTVKDVRDLRGVMDRESAEIGVLITFKEPTRPMGLEAAKAGFYFSPGWRKRYPRLQILTIAELLQGGRIDYPPTRQGNVTFKKAPRAKRQEHKRRLEGL